MWQGIHGMVRKSGEGEKTRVATLRAVGRRLVSSGKGRKEIPAEHYGRLGTPLRLMKHSRNGWTTGSTQKMSVAPKGDSGNREIENKNISSLTRLRCA